ncbi:hypothetical protein [Microbacterium sp. G2-8]|uniref:hypothetical protein n=1 Tax=Microbacterium sp. G2-8 TaxID=2842454 RepID=UPI001C8AD760|nr:hypothetical protein [Microbacterium sp. G2-8]
MTTAARPFDASPTHGEVVGAEFGHTSLHASGPKPPLGPGGWPLPVLTAKQQRPRSWWRHPALIVSSILTILAILGMTAWMIVSAVLSSDVVVGEISLTIEDGQAHVDWDGPPASYDLYGVSGDGSVTDLSQFVMGGTDAWLPSATATWDDATCFVVRGSEHADVPVSLSADDLAAQGAQSTCVAAAQ